MTVLPLELSVLIAPLPSIFFFTNYACCLRVTNYCRQDNKRVLFDTEFVACSKQVALLNFTSQAQVFC